MRSRELASGKLTTSAMIRHLSGLGVHSVELMDAAISGDDLPSLVAILADANVSVVGAAAGCDLIVPAGPARDAQVARAARAMDRAARLGARMVLLYLDTRHDDVTADVARGRIGEILAHYLEEASHRGLQVTVESLGLQPTVCARSEHLIAICEAAGPDLRLTYDSGNPLLAGEDPVDWLDRVADRLRGRIVHAHFKAWTIVEPPVSPDPFAYPDSDGRWYRGAVLGEGAIDLPRARAPASAWIRRFNRARIRGR